MGGGGIRPPIQGSKTGMDRLPGALPRAGIARPVGAWGMRGYECPRALPWAGLGRPVGAGEQFQTFRFREVLKAMLPTILLTLTKWSEGRDVAKVGVILIPSNSMELESSK